MIMGIFNIKIIKIKDILNNKIYLKVKFKKKIKRLG
jgi:hypothetical protein